MPKSPNDMIDAVVKNMPAKTGKTAEQWMGVLRKDGPEGYKAQVDWLKEEHGLGHVQASLVAQFLKQGGNVYVDGGKLIDDLFSGKNAGLRPLYDRLAKEITGLGGDVRIQPALTYVMFYRKRKFAQVRPWKGAIEIGLALPDKTAKKVDKPGGPDRINTKLAVAAAGDLEIVMAEMKKAYETN